jgi:hypothetical protein
LLSLGFLNSNLLSIDGFLDTRYLLLDLRDFLLLQLDSDEVILLLLVHVKLSDLLEALLLLIKLSQLSIEVIQLKLKRVSLSRLSSLLIAYVVEFVTAGLEQAL